MATLLSQLLLEVKSRTLDGVIWFLFCFDRWPSWWWWRPLWSQWREQRRQERRRAARGRRHRALPGASSGLPPDQQGEEEDDGRHEEGEENENEDEMIVNKTRRRRLRMSKTATSPGLLLSLILPWSPDDSLFPPPQIKISFQTWTSNNN